MITLLNSPILTAHGTYRYEPIGIEDARRIIQERPWQSAVGHAATAEVMSALLGVAVPRNRIRYVQSVGDAALVLVLRQRIPEGVVLDRASLDEIGYDFGLLIRTE